MQALSLRFFPLNEAYEHADREVSAWLVDISTCQEAGELPEGSELSHTRSPRRAARR